MSVAQILVRIFVLGHPKRFFFLNRKRTLSYGKFSYVCCFPTQHIEHGEEVSKVM